MMERESSKAKKILFVLKKFESREILLLLEQEKFISALTSLNSTCKGVRAKNCFTAQLKDVGCRIKFYMPRAGVNQ